MPVTVVVLSDFIPESVLGALSDELLDRVTSDVMAGARSFWIQKANERLHSSRRDYVDGIQEVVTESGQAGITLVGALALMVENGASAFDMHDTLLGPGVPLSKKHMNKQGQFYRSIPFRHQTPGSAGQGGGSPMGSPYSGMLGIAGAAALGKTVYNRAKQLKPGQSLEEGLAPLLKPIHSTDIYSGMRKTGKGAQAHYETFRTISDSAPGKWLHPGIPAAHIADDVAKYVGEIAPAAVLAAVENAL